MQNDFNYRLVCDFWHSDDGYKVENFLHDNSGTDGFHSSHNLILSHEKKQQQQHERIMFWHFRNNKRKH